MKGYRKRKNCSSCNSNDFSVILNLGIVPLAGYFPNKDEIGVESKYPLSLLVCNGCKLTQTDSVINPKILFEDYRYLSSVGLSNHFNEVANILDKKYNVKGKHILEIGCNDGVLLEPLSKLGAEVEGVDPAVNVVKIATDRGLKVYNDYFNDETFGHEKFKSKYDLVVSNNAFAHIIDIQSVIRGIRYVLKPNGNFIFEVHYLDKLIKGKQWDNVYHEHIFYYSITSLKNMFERYDMTLIDFEEIPIHSGSIRVTVANKKTNVADKISKKVELESHNIANLNYLLSYGKDVKQHILHFKKEITKLSKNNKIAGYGASGRANMFCNLTGLDVDTIKFIVDESPERCGRYIANTKIPIVDVETLKNSDIDILIIFAWNYSKMIIEKTQFKNYSYLIAFPTIQLVKSYDDLKGFDSI
jgi:SAM-dependent methyltransferase